MNDNRNIILGIVLIALGIIIMASIFDFISYDILFDGWWTLLIIIPCSIGLITDENKIPSLFGVIIGIMLLLACQNIISFDFIIKLICPLVLIIAGIRLINKDKFSFKH